VDSVREDLPAEALSMTTIDPIGFPLLPLPDEHGYLHWPTLEESVAQQIRVILLTLPGEQLMRPEYGAGLENFLHEPNTLTTRRRIRDALTEALTRHERRILLDDVAVLEVPNAPAQIRVEIAYRLRRTGAAKRTGLTLDLV
jgi:phage baseplate assembly protein W